ncbi:glycine receptor subunit alpha-4-like [Convolutriloba macropyga]|uniref:glycine receptor subunit alpha-4-like n=1 Tax=Convolutriloba macropyga TaxID=536237 RepID=UPI003F52862F
MSFVIKLSSIILCTTLSVNCNNLSDEMSELLERLVNNYDANLRPNFGGKPVRVKVSMHVDSIGPISEVNMNFRLDISFRQIWKDARLRYDDKYNNTFTLSHGFLKRIWTPDTYFPDSLSADKQDVMTPNVLLRLFPDGKILYSARVTIFAKCPMKLHYFPMDMQVCKLLVECYGYTTKDLILQWDDPRPAPLNGGGDHEEETAVQVPHHLQVPQFSLVDTIIDSYTLQFSTGNFSDLEVNFLFKRDLMYFILQSYVPSTLIVFLSWVSFWVNRNSIPARASLSITSILTLITLIGTTNSNLPKVSEVKALDVYFAMCSVYVFGAILEFASTCYLTTREKNSTTVTPIAIQETTTKLTSATIRLTTNFDPEYFDEQEVKTAEHQLETVQYQVETSFCSHKSDPNDFKCPNVEIIRENTEHKLCDLVNSSHDIAKQFTHSGETHLVIFNWKLSASKLETYSRIGFPSSFLLMQVCYWLFYWHMTSVHSPLHKFIDKDLSTNNQ